MEISAVRKPPPEQADQLLSLYIAEGWWDERSATREALVRFIQGSWVYLIATEDGRVIGTGRAVSDGVSDAYIQDVAVAPSSRGKGVGSRIIQGLVARLKAADIGWIGLIAERGSRPFYEGLGFQAMPDSTPMVRKEGPA